MSPRTADPAIRKALVEHAARLIAEEGSAALTLRRLADEVGTSTMAIYTHFGGMEELRAEVVREGFRRLADAEAEVPETDDPVADLVALGVAYLTNALENPNLYRVMFAHPPPAAAAHEGARAYQYLLDRVARVAATAPSEGLATKLWGLVHGLAMLELSQFVGAGAAVQNLLDAMGAMFPVPSSPPPHDR